MSEEYPWDHDRIEDLEQTVTHLLDYLAKDRFQFVTCTCRYQETGHDSYDERCERNQREEEFKTEIRRGY